MQLYCITVWCSGGEYAPQSNEEYFPHVPHGCRVAKCHRRVGSHSSQNERTDYRFCCRRHEDQYLQQCCDKRSLDSPTLFVAPG